MAKSAEAQAAQAIRRELKDAGIAFDRIFSRTKGTSSVKVEITDADPETMAVASKIASKYRMGTFDPQNDLYVYDNSNSDLPLARYVHVSNNISPAMAAELDQYIEKYDYERISKYQIFTGVIGKFWERRQQV